MSDVTYPLAREDAQGHSEATTADVLDGRADAAVVAGDALTVLRSLPAESVRVCMTSPPYFGLRDAGLPDQLGVEALHDCGGWATGQRCGRCYVCRLTAVFGEVRRTLRRDGTLWLNIGDAYAGAGKWGGKSGVEAHPTRAARMSRTLSRRVPPGLKRKDLMGLPWRLALALQADGWYLRADAVWCKTGLVGPTSARDRPAVAHEHVFLLARSEHYFYDRDAGSGLASWWTDIKPEVVRGAKCPPFPTGLPDRCIRLSSTPGDVVLDPFCGSGSTGVAARRLSRRFLGIELDQGNAALARQRIGKALEVKRRRRARA